LTNSPDSWPQGKSLSSRFSGSALCLSGSRPAESGAEIEGKTLAAIPGHPSVRREYGGAIDRKFGKASVKPNSESEA
jgi:hypothetical protein